MGRLSRSLVVSQCLCGVLLVVFLIRVSIIALFSLLPSLIVFRSHLLFPHVIEHYCERVDREIPLIRVFNDDKVIAAAQGRIGRLAKDSPPALEAQEVEYLGTRVDLPSNSCSQRAGRKAAHETSAAVRLDHLAYAASVLVAAHLRNQQRAYFMNEEETSGRLQSVQPHKWRREDATHACDLRAQTAAGATEKWRENRSGFSYVVFERSRRVCHREGQETSGPDRRIATKTREYPTGRLPQ